MGVELFIIVLIVALIGGCVGWMILDGEWAFVRGAAGIFVLIGVVWLFL